MAFAYVLTTRKQLISSALILFSLVLTACSPDAKFSELTLSSKLEIPVTLEPTNPTEPVPASFSKTSGTCAADSSTKVTSCLSCEIPPLPPVEPPMSLKARQLRDILLTACPINNASSGNRYPNPTKEDHVAKINRCSSVAYPATTPDAGQANVVNRLLNNDLALQRRMFTGLYYKPPYSDYFETYFGLEVKEAILIFCSGQQYAVSGDLYPSMTANNPYGPKYEVGDDLPWEYKRANVFRDQLISCMSGSRSNPWTPSGPAPEPKKCTYETIAGEAGVEITTQVATWIAAGYTVGVDVKNTGLCALVNNVSDVSSYTGELIVGAYKCQ